MEERYKLYRKLRQQVCSIMPFVELVEKDCSKIKIGKGEISLDEFLKMENEFCKIRNSTNEELDISLQTNFIPLSLVNTNVFFKEIQITLNEIYQEKVEKLYEDNER